MVLEDICWDIFLLGVLKRLAKFIYMCAAVIVQLILKSKLSVYGVDAME